MSQPELTAAAISKLESNDFAGARSLLREAAMMQDPTEGVLANLSVAEDEEILDFRRSLSHIHASSLVCVLGEIQALLNVRRPTHAIQLATRKLSSEQHTLHDEIRLRLLRFKAAVQGGGSECLVADFLRIWRAASLLPAAMRFRPGLIRQVSSVHHSDFSAVVHDLSLNPDLPSVVRDFLKSKALELDLLSAVDGLELL